MPTILIEAQVPTSKLLEAVKQLSQPEFETFVSQVLALRAQRVAPCAASREAELLGQINQGLPVGLKHKYEELIAKRREETLTPEEHAELLHLMEEVEKRNVIWIQHLTELAQLRNKPLPQLMQELGIQTPAYE